MGLTLLVALFVINQAAVDLAPLAAGGSEIAVVIDALRRGQAILLVIGLGGFLAGLVAIVIAANHAARIIERLKRATQQLTNVQIDEDLVASQPGEGDDLELEIREMVLKIKASQQVCLDASPLTRLPGNNAIEQVLKNKMAQNEKFALCYIDLDDFKAYNDKYGYAKGSELIKLTGEIIHHAKARHAHADDFVGHIGGDDFVLITSPERVKTVCEAIIAEFDQAIPAHYDAEDRQRGFIEGHDRYGVKRRFALMTISIAVVTDVRREFSSPIEIAQVATEIKDYVKSLPGSNYLIDRRVSARRET